MKDRTKSTFRMPPKLIIRPFLILFILFPSIAYSQDTAGVNRLNRLSEQFQDKNPDSARNFSEQALAQAQAIHYAKGITVAYNNLGWIFYRKGNYKKASEYAFAALRLAEQVKDHNEAGRANNTIGSVYNDQFVQVNSLSYFKKALAEYEEAKNTTGIGRVLNNLAYTSFQANMIDSALIYANRAFAINNTLPNSYFLGFTLRTLGDIYKAKNEFTRAYQNFHASLRISEQIQNNFLRVTDLNRLGLLHFELHRIDSSIFYYAQARDIALTFGFKSILVQAYAGLAKSYAAENKFQQAFSNQLEYSELNDSLKLAANTETISILRSNYEADKQEAEINLLKKEKKIEQITVAEQKQFITTLVIVVLLVFLFALFLFRRYSYEKKFNKTINEQAERLREVNAELKETVSFKDKVLSILSHDLRSPLAALSSTMILLDNKALSADEFDMIKQKLAKQLGALNMTLDNLLNWAITQSKKDIQPDKTKLNLQQLVKENIELTEQTAEQKKIGFNVQIPDDAFVFADPNQIGMVCRNLLSNAIKFSFQSGVIDVFSKEESGFYTLCISDHGTGIPSAEQSRLFNSHIHHSTYGTMNEKGTGIGLILSKEFVEINGGTIGFESSANGTTFYFSLPKFEA